MKHDLLTEGFSLPTSEYLLFICFQIYLVHVLAMTGNMSAVAGYTPVLILTRKFKGLDFREITSLPDFKKVIYMASHFNHCEINPMLTTS